METRELLWSLRAICGDEAVCGNGEDVACYAHDALGMQRGFRSPTSAAAVAVIEPSTAAQIAAVIRLAQEQRVPVTPYGAGTGLMGGATALRGGIVLRTSGLASVRAIDAVDGSVLCEAGCVLADVSRSLAPHGLMIAHDPWTVSIATVGGAISTDGLGFLGGAYGRMGAQVLGLEAVLADGTIVRTQDAPAHAAGIDLKSLLIGSEGTLGVITVARLHAFPVPEERALRGWRFSSFVAGFGALVALRRAGLVPSVLDFGERPATTADPGEPATLYLGFDGPRAVVAAQLDLAAKLCRDGGAVPVEQAETNAFWNERHDVAERFAEARRARRTWRGVGERKAFDYVHVALPTSAVLAYYEQARGIARAHGVHIVEAGLWVSTQLFSLTIACTGNTQEDAVGRMSAAVDALLHVAHDAGGSIEYCHGIGARLAHLAPLEYGSGRDAVRAIKRALDPHGILNPGKLGID